MTKDTTELTHSLLLTIRNQDQSSRSILSIRLIATIETTSFQLNNLVFLKIVASIIHDDGVLKE